ncbi:MAG: type II toxin-antitoxin system VapB family antitoxin [Elusimicrobia bacterium]|nr:type II toxin-antitoxin system VapB family antitoxin [Elusimicrobiota bacterium]
MRTTLNLPRDLIREAQKLTGARTKTQAIIWGLEELRRRKKIENLWKLRGNLYLDLNLKKARAR